MKNNIIIEIAKESDIKEICSLIKKTCKISFKDFYPKEWINVTVSRQNVTRLREKLKNHHFYIAKYQNKIVGTGAIGYSKEENISCLLSFFVDPDFQKMGIGKNLIYIIEKDEYFLKSNKIVVPASLPAIPFYKKMGYNFKNNQMMFNHIDGSFLLEKNKKQRFN